MTEYLKQRAEVMNPPVSAAWGTEARNLNMAQMVIGLGVLSCRKAKGGATLCQRFAALPPMRI